MRLRPLVSSSIGVRRLRWKTLLAVAVCEVLRSSSVWACPSCKLLADQQSEQPRAYMLSVFFMLGMIGAVCGTVIFVLYRLHKYERLQLEEAGYYHLFDNAASPAPSHEATDR